MKSERFQWAASLGALVGYALTFVSSFPMRLVYDPQAASWGTMDVAGQPVIRWYGRLAVAALGALLAMGIAWPIRRGVRWPVIWLLATLLLVVLAWHERHWFHAARLP